MKNSITRQPLTITLVLFSVLLLFFWFRHLFFPLTAEVPVINSMPLGAAITSWFDGYPYIECGVSLLFIYLTAIVVTRLILRNLVFPARTYIFLIFMVVTGYGIYIRSGNFPVIFSGYLLVKASEYFASAFRRTARFADSFNGALLLGIVPLVYAPAAIYLLLMPIAMSVYMRSGRETAIASFGLILPMLTYSYITWAMGEPFLQLYYGIYESIISPGSGILTLDIYSATGITRLFSGIMLVAVIIMSLWTFMVNARKIRTRAYRIYLYMVLFLVVSVMGLFLPCASIGDLPLLALPVSIVCASYFSHYQGVVPNLVYAFMVIGAVIYNITLIL